MRTNIRSLGGKKQNPEGWQTLSTCFTRDFEHANPLKGGLTNKNTSAKIKARMIGRGHSSGAEKGNVSREKCSGCGWGSGAFNKQQKKEGETKNRRGVGKSWYARVQHRSGGGTSETKSTKKNR